MLSRTPGLQAEEKDHVVYFENYNLEDRKDEGGIQNKSYVKVGAAVQKKNEK